MTLKNRTLSAALIIASLCTAATALASPPRSGKNAESRSMTIAMNDVNIATAAGYHKAVARISAVARHLCNRLHNSARVDDRESAAECIRVAIAEASSQLRPTPVHPGQ